MAAAESLTIHVGKLRHVSRREVEGGLRAYESAPERRTRKRSDRLSPAERAELEYLWGAYTADLGSRSVQGAIEDRLRRAQPRDEVRKLPGEVPPADS
jgi:hypothetical protein